MPLSSILRLFLKVIRSDLIDASRTLVVVIPPFLW
jgi:hypothetical protein